MTQIQRYLKLGLAWWWLILLLTAGGIGAGYLYGSRQPPVYQSTATIIVEEPNTRPAYDFDVSRGENVARTFAEMASRYSVLQEVIQTLDLNYNWQALRNGLQARPIQGTQLLEITMRAGSPEEAMVIANGIAQQLVQISVAQQQAQDVSGDERFVRDRLDQLQAKIETGQARLEELEQQLETPLTVEQLQDIQAEINELEGLVTGWEANYGQLLAFSKSNSEPASFNLRIVEPAIASTRPLQNKLLQYLLVGAIAGLGVAIGLVYFIDSLDKTVRSIDVFSDDLRLANLGSVSKIHGADYPEKLPTLKDPFSPQSEAYRMVRTQIQFLTAKSPVKSIIITSPAPGEGKSVTSANLGIVMAQAGLKTIIVDADLRKPVQHQIFQVSNAKGLTDLVQVPKLKPEAYLASTELENLYILPAGTPKFNPAELLGSRHMQELLTRLEKMADVVILDTPPVLSVTDTAILSNWADGVVLVVRAAQTVSETITKAIAILKRADANIVGGVLNNAPAEADYYYHSYSIPLKTAPVEQQLYPKLKLKDKLWQWLFFLR